MPVLARAASLWRSLVHRSRVEDDLDDELRGYLDALVAKKAAAGADPASARRDALREVGGIDRIKDAVRDERSGQAIESTLRDVRFAWRGLRRSPGFTAVAVLTLALGIGANTAIFSVVRAMLISPLPFRDPSQLVFVWADLTASGYPRAPLAAPEVKDLRDRSTLFTGFGAIWASTAALTGDDNPEQLRIAFVTTDFFSVLGADAALGRTFRPDDEQQAQAPPRAILLSWATWQRRFGGDPAIVGRRILVNNQPNTVVGVMPWRTNLADRLQQDGRRVAGGMHYQARSALVVLQIALSVVLLVSAALMVRSFLALQRVDPGFRSDHTLSFRLALPGATLDPQNRNRSREAFNEFGRRLQAALRALPGVAGVGSVSHLPFDNLPNWGGPYITRPGEDDSLAPMADNRAVTPGFFEAVGARLVDGRFFIEDDDLRAQPVVIVDDQLARRAWPGESAVGKRIASDPASTGHAVSWATVVGVVHHLRHRSLLEDLGDQVYLAERQVSRNPMAYVVRTTGDPGAIAASVRQIVAGLDPTLPVYDLRPLDEYVVGARAAQRFTTIVAGAFAFVALILAAVGVYGVIAYAMTRRRYEFGVRLALGAQPSQVTALVLWEGAALVGTGLVFGLATAAILARLLESQLYAVSPRDAVSYAAAAAAIGAVAIVACWWPARRASAISPLEAIRAE